ncbi:uncharacterized protein LOC119078573 [Bradysia coprophila]|uniref:uncharacterized protein LOC119078573 n=1 Tax=Bradysia coprophila TaxID=38358 RepID=UPI00187D8DB8|nr:uncharacterized protein LOC119078573 [Bradysia coprophila]
MVSKVAKRRYSRLIKSWRLILHSLGAMIYWAVIIAGLDCYLSGFKSLTAQHWILYLSATSVTIGSWVFANPRSRWMKISSEILLFSLSEFAIFSTTITNLLWLLRSNFFNNFLYPSIDLDEVTGMGRNIIMVSYGYSLVLFSIMNTVIHSTYIYHLVRGTEKKVAAYIDPVRIIYCSIGITIIMGITYVVLSLAETTDPATVDLSLVWNLIFVQFIVWLAASLASVEFRRGKANTMKESLMSDYFSYCRVLGMMLVLFTITYVIVVFRIVNMAENFETVRSHLIGGRRIMLSDMFPKACMLVYCGFASQHRYQYLWRKISASSKRKIKKRR